MTHIELYINKTLCDILSPEKLGVRLNRVLINPSELSTKDAQYSYSITIPSTPVNDAIFGYANVEEVKNKFNHIHTAQLYVDNVRIFDGRFKLSEIDADGNYKGNLVVPAKKTIKEIFGETKMTEVPGEWKLDITDPRDESRTLNMVEMMNRYNTDKGTPRCIFPLVLYGLLPKVPKFPKDEKEEYSGKTIWDKYVRLGIEDFPPSINCLQAITQIFKHHKNDKNEPYEIGGSAFDDERLKNLYMSYKNPTDYQQEWNWGHLGKFRISGRWTNIKNDNTDILRSHLETQFYQTQGDYEHIAVNLLSAKNSDITINEDNGTNAYQWKKKNEEDGSVIENTHIVIPASGLYKITFKGTMKVGNADGDNASKNNTDLNLRFAYANSPEANNGLKSVRYELKLIRDRGNGDFDMNSAVIDGVFFKNNQNQERDKTGEVDEATQFPHFEKAPKYFPQAESDAILFVDPCQNANIISGFRWGKHDVIEAGNPVDKDELNCSILSAKSGFSWDKSIDTLTYSAVKSPGYWRYGVLQKSEEETEEEGTEGGEEKEDEIVKERVYEISDKFKIDLNSPDNYIEKQDNENGDGLVHSIIWLEKGERITIVDVADIGVWRRKEGKKRKEAYIKHEVTFDLQIEPYKVNSEWLSVNFEGTGTAPMDWYEPSDFKKNYINLFKFLPSDQKIDDWLNNFCKAFNLELIQPKEGKFELNVKQTRLAASVPSVIDLDGKASIARRTNEPLGLPSEFQLGFKINQEEEGYVKSPEFNNGVFEDGGGSFFTGNIDGQVVPQTSNFSYNWFKKITRKIENGLTPIGEEDNNGNDPKLELPVITNKEIWKAGEVKDYEVMMKKIYTTYAQRFWYKNNQTNNVGIVWKNKPELQLIQLKNSLRGNTLTLHLDYYNKPNSILNSYFNIIATDDSNYTYVECYLTPDEYEQLDGNKLVKLNSDLYYIASVEGYDPTGRNKTKLKLIRKV